MIHENPHIIREVYRGRYMLPRGNCSASKPAALQPPFLPPNHKSTFAFSIAIVVVASTTPLHPPPLTTILVLILAGNSVLVAEITCPTTEPSAGDGETERAVALTSSVNISAGRRELMMFSSSGSSSCPAWMLRFKSGSLIVVV